MDEATARRIVAARAGQRCETCGAPYPTDYAHRKARSAGGLWAPSNGLRMCRACHTWAHAHPRAARVRGWIVDSTEDPLLTPVWAFWFGWGRWWLLDDDGSFVFPEEEQ